MSEVIEQVQQSAKPIAPARTAQSVLARMGERFGVDPGKLFESLRSVAFRQQGNRAPSNEQMMALLVVAETYRLNPFLKEIYAFPDKNDNIVPVVGIDGWIRITQGHEAYDGEEFVFGPDDKAGLPEWVECRIFRKDRSRPTIVREFMAECRRSTGPWGSHPRRMLRHKAFIQCARVAFGFGGIYDQDEAERIIDGEARVISTADDPMMQDIEARAARRAAAAPALEQSQPVTIEAQATRKEPEAVEVNTAIPKGDAKPESAAADSAPSDTGGGAPDAAAPASKASAGPAVTAKSIEKQMRGAKTMDALNDAASLINALPVSEQKSLNELYKERAAAFGVE